MRISDWSSDVCSSDLADFLYQNLMIEANVIEAAFRNEVEKLLFLGSSCIYPKFADQPIREESLLTGALEPTNEWYRSEESRVGKECVSKFRSRWSPYH